MMIIIICNGSEGKKLPLLTVVNLIVEVEEEKIMLQGTGREKKQNKK